MNVPQSNRKKALIIVDVQPAFLNPQNEYVVPRIEALLKETPYAAYVNAVFHAEKGSLWDKQQGWVCPEGADTKTVSPVAEALLGLNALEVTKETRSVFKGEPDTREFLVKQGVEEVHIVGLETDDCVLATAHEAFDLGFFAYVIEECCGTSAEDPVFHEKALEILRRQNITNHSYRP